MNQIILASHGGLAAGAKDTLEKVLGDVSTSCRLLVTTRSPSPIRWTL